MLSVPGGKLRCIKCNYKSKSIKARTISNVFQNGKEGVEPAWGACARSALSTVEQPRYHIYICRNLDNLETWVSFIN